MKNAFTPWFDLMLGHATPLQRAAWFVLGSVEREQRLNLDALTAQWLSGPMAWWAVPAAARRSEPESAQRAVRRRAARGSAQAAGHRAGRGRRAQIYAVTRTAAATSSAPSPRAMPASSSAASAGMTASA